MTCHTPYPSHCHEVSPLIPKGPSYCPCLVHGARHALVHGKLFSPACAIIIKGPVHTLHQTLWKECSYLPIRITSLLCQAPSGTLGTVPVILLSLALGRVPKSKASSFLLLLLLLLDGSDRTEVSSGAGKEWPQEVDDISHKVSGLEGRLDDMFIWEVYPEVGDGVAAHGC
ncbi:hypothetical protein E2C01_004820 [Portunus trituberculatus]|uniref:Uncharacterized protein n=1 Tax=Portunus trituberculatus TaxID=210409 RepID=A0A5B7CTC6_PORTR|nr:hypothetical protein [Portunus trituberculatus]